jgi:hypothetical protein
LKLFLTKSEDINLSVAATIFAAFCGLSTLIKYSIQVGDAKLNEEARNIVRNIIFFIFLS